MPTGPPDADAPQTTMKTTQQHQQTKIRNSKKLPATIAFLTPIAMLANAQDSPTQFLEPSTFDQLWSYATLYKNDMNPILEEFKLRGRYQGQFHSVDSAQGSDDAWEDRRSRFGFDAKLFEKKVEVRVDAQSNDQFQDLYDGLVDAYIRWKPNSWLSITAGKTKPLIGQYDWLESTNTQPTFERSQIFNQLGINRATALTVEGTTDEFSWRGGIYSNGTPSTTGGTGAFGDGEFGDLDGGTSYSLGVGYDFKHLLNLEKASLNLDWLHSNRKAGDLVLGKYDDIISTTFVAKEGYTNVVLEGFYATGSDYVPKGGDKGNGDVFGLYIQPTYDLIPSKLQLVGRYSYATGDGDKSLSAQKRYEQAAPDIVPFGKAKGDQYQALYLGAQYFIYGDKLKLMAGAEYAHLNGGPSADDYEGVTYLAGVRFSF